MLLKKIAYITDTHIDESYPAKWGIDTRKNLEFLLQDVQARGVKEIVFGGDIGEKHVLPWFFDAIKAFKLDITLGNHDTFADVKQYTTSLVLADQQELYYSYEDAYCKYVFMDSSSRSISNKQYLWLKKVIHTDKKILLFIHHPVLSLHTAMDKKYYLLERSKIKTVLQNLKNEVFIFCGHYHMEDETVEGNIKQFNTAAVSYQVIKLPDQIKIDNTVYGYRIINVYHDKIETASIVLKTHKLAGK